MRFTAADVSRHPYPVQTARMRPNRRINSGCCIMGKPDDAKQELMDSSPIAVSLKVEHPRVVLAARGCFVFLCFELTEEARKSRLRRAFRAG